MSLDTQIYFYIILSGFITVWTFRYLTKSQKPVDTFEYLGLSAFWGLTILMLSSKLLEIRNVAEEKVNLMYSNPLAIGFVFSIFFGVLFGFFGTLLAIPVRWIANQFRQKVLGIKK